MSMKLFDEEVCVLLLLLCECSLRISQHLTQQDWWAHACKLYTTETYITSLKSCEAPAMQNVPNRGHIFPFTHDYTFMTYLSLLE